MLRQALLIIPVILLAACAQPKVLSGGSDDVHAPKVNWGKSGPPNGTVNFDHKSIVLQFDEYFKLIKPHENIVFLPPIEPRPEIYVKGKNMIIDLEDSRLEDKVTYQVMFNGAIADLNEGNDSVFSYVFSTGSFIDSLKVDAMVLDARTSKPVKSARVLLYRSSADSMVYTSLPDYVGTTGQNGKVTIDYVSPGSYQCVALTDDNRNLIYDQPSEKLGFLDQLIEVGPLGTFSAGSATPGVDSTEPPSRPGEVRLRASHQRDTAMRLRSQSWKNPGVLTLVYNEPVHNLVLDNAPEYLLNSGLGTDSLTLLFPHLLGDTTIIVSTEQTKDTISIFGFNQEYILKQEFTGKLRTANRLNPFLPVEVLFAHRLASFPDRVMTYSLPDSTLSYTHFVQHDSLPILVSDTTFSPDKSYVFHFPARSLENVFGQKNNETNLPFTPERESAYGDLKLSMSGFPVSDGILLVYLSGKLVEEIPGQAGSFKLAHLEPGDYIFEWVQDENGNGKWDGGLLKAGLQPERIFRMREKVSVRANWDSEVSWKLERFF